MAKISKNQTFSTLGHHHPDDDLVSPTYRFYFKNILAFNSIFYSPFILGSSIGSSPSSGSPSGSDVGDKRRGAVSKNKGIQREISIR